uniref:Uncharacterized protein n=1 Tax=Palpitomonas bilix TaxID=652834 RepID=A0A7S3D5A4_9EUKA
MRAFLALIAAACLFAGVYSACNMAALQVGTVGVQLICERDMAKNMTMFEGGNNTYCAQSDCGKAMIDLWVAARDCMGYDCGAIPYLGDDCPDQVPPPMPDYSGYACPFMTVFEDNAEKLCPGIIQAAFDQWWAGTDEERGCSAASGSGEGGSGNAASASTGPSYALIAAAGAAVKYIRDMF